MAKVYVIVTAGILLQLFATFESLSQQIDTAFVALAQKKSSGQYTQAIELQSRLYNGHDYVFYIAKDDEHPYFIVDHWAFGSIVYWGELYENVAMLYDLSTDQVITENRSGATIRLIAEKIESFTIAGHNFVRLRKDDKNDISEGFYDLLYAGKLKVYARYFKEYKETLTNREVIPNYEENKRYFVVKDGIFHGVKSKSTLLNILQDHKQELKSFIRKNRISFHTDKESALVRISEYYDSLTE
jgi:hypothetical protein